MLLQGTGLWLPRPSDEGEGVEKAELEEMRGSDATASKSAHVGKVLYKLVFLSFKGLGNLVLIPNRQSIGTFLDMYGLCSGEHINCGHVFTVVWKIFVLKIFVYKMFVLKNFCNLQKFNSRSIM